MREIDDMQVSYAEYLNIHNALVGDLQEEIKRKESIIKRYTQDVKDIKTRMESIITAHDRAIKEG